MTWEQPVTLVLVGAVSQGIMLPFLAGAALYFRHRRIDTELRPGLFWTVCLWIAAVSMASIGLYQAIKEIAKALGA